MKLIISKLGSKTLIILLLLLSVSVLIFLQNHCSKKLRLDDAGTARLMEDGSEVKILTAKTANGYGLVFLFVDKSENIINTLSVENIGLDAPSYRIVRGNKHDWLVVNTIDSYGTGTRQEKDSWYLVKNTYRGVLKVLSYTAFSSDYSATTSTSIETTAMVSYKNDNSLDIDYTIKACDEKSTCNTSTKTDQYVWQDSNSENMSRFVPLQR